jgi:uncharacterized coiled-coil protein SlyX
LTTLTKIFIVFLVVLSLLLSAGVVVFVNRTDDFKTTMAAQASSISTLKSEVQSTQREVGRQSADAAAARKERDNVIADEQQKIAAVTAEKSALTSQVAELKSVQSADQVTAANLTSALTASETARKSLADVLEASRTTNNQLSKDNSEMNLRVADLTNRLEVATRQVTNLNESVAEYKAELDKAQRQVLSLGGSPNVEPPTKFGAPPIDGVIVSTQPQGGIPYATIRVGSQDQVKRGMKFSIVDREKGKFLGELTVEQVDEKEATGRLEGPGLSDIQAGKTEVKTQL